MIYETTKTRYFSDMLSAYTHIRIEAYAVAHEEFAQYELLDNGMSVDEYEIRQESQSRYDML